MRLRTIVLAAFTAVGLGAAHSAMAAVTLTFDVDVAGSTAADFSPFSFQETWVLSPDGSATVSDTATTTAMKGLVGTDASYLTTWRLLDDIGEIRDPTASTVRLVLDETASGGRPFDLSLTATLDARLLTDGLPDFESAIGSRPFVFDLKGPGLPRVGEVRDPGIGTAHYSGVAHLAAVAVPEPRAWALMILGFGCLGATLRGRRREMA